MNLEFAFPSKNIIIVNPRGTVAVCTLWTSPEFVERKLRGEAPNLFHDAPLALIGGLYGGGLKIMLRNLLYNPQIDAVLLYGRDYSGAGRHLKSFFLGRVERTGKRLSYIFEDGHEETLEKVAVIGDESKYVMDGLVLPGSFRHPPAIIDGLAFDPATTAPLVDWLNAYRPPGPAEKKRLLVPLPAPVIDTFPSDTSAHVIAADTIFGAWPKLLFRLARFGNRVAFRSGKVRNELLNVKAVIHNPGSYSNKDLRKFNICPSEVKQYQDDLLTPGLPDAGQLSYTYGQRLGSYFGVNMLEEMAADLCLDKDSRRNMAVLWDNVHDRQGGDPPCLITLFFRKIEDRVNLTVTFRSHNAARAWPRNCLGLVAVMRRVCGLANKNPGRTEPRHLRPGVLTIFSQSISIDPGDLEDVSGFIEDYRNRNPKPAKDPNGYFTITLDREAREIVVHHFDHENELIDEYRGRSTSEICKRLYRNEAISDISHALYMGSQLEKASVCLENGLEYWQDKTRIPLKK
jgi:thymidylate synthase